MPRKIKMHNLLMPNNDKKPLRITLQPYTTCFVIKENYMKLQFA